VPTTAAAGTFSARHETLPPSLPGDRIDSGRLVKGGAMPTYEYRCENCGERFEIACHMDERETLAVCPHCKSKDVTPVITSFTCEAPKKW
jgi:putative FmdB family regulatory protein